MDGREDEPQKRVVYRYLGFVLIRYGREADMEVSVLKADIYYTHSSRGIGDMATTGRGGADPETLEPRRQKEGGEDMGKSLYCAFHGKDQVRQAEQA